MDRRRAFAALLLTVAGHAAFSAAPDLPIREARWIAPERRLSALSSEPVECVVPPISAEARDAWHIGRTAFRAPLLLGGQAARAELSCASCHRNGRGNPDFQFPGLSGDSGTADVTSSLMSSHRGNGRFDPKPIPDLAMDARKISRSRERADLRVFLRGLIMQEFDGAEPPSRVLAGLVTYVSSLDKSACPERPTRGITLGAMIDDARLASQAALSALAAHDPQTARLMLGAARSGLGRIDERYAVPGLAADRARLIRLDQLLAKIQSHAASGQTDTRAMIIAWQASLYAAVSQLERDAPQSLFDAEHLAKALEK